MIANLIKKFQDPLTVGKDLFIGNYPSFVYGGELNKRQIPIFIFHEVVPAYFENILIFLQENNYNTLTVTELFDDYIDAGKELPEKSIIITFDDGAKSVWCVVHPLLKKYGFKCTTFLIPGRMQEGDALSVNLEDYWAGTCSGEELMEVSRQGLANWQEIKKIHDEGTIDFQSHSNNHELIFTSNRIHSFVSPDILRRFHPFEFPREPGDIIPLGRPIYDSAPRLSDSLKCYEDEAYKKACIETVQNAGGEAFFQRDNWEDELRNLATGLQSRYETETERNEHIFRDLSNAKTEIEKRLQNKVEHLCLPWGTGGEVMLQSARQAGYRAVYWGKVDGRLVFDIKKDNPLKISRIGEDFIFLLPGKGRQNVLQLIKKKFSRRLSQGSPFLSH